MSPDNAELQGDRMKTQLAKVLTELCAAQGPYQGASVAEAHATSIDYGSSFLFFRDTGNDAGEDHTPRALIDASCTLQAPGAAAPTRFYAGAPCATERMYTATGLIHEPMAEFRFHLRHG